MKSEKPIESSVDCSIQHPFLRGFASAMIFALVIALAIIIIRNSEQNRRQLERARISHIAGDYAHALQFNIERALSTTFSLAALVRQGNGHIPDFEATASEMLSFFPGADSLQLAPNGIVQRIFPLAGNEKAIGHDLLKDPARTKEAFLARDSGKLTLAGPFNLVQGGIGAVGRLPVFLDNSSGGSFFWGFTIVLIRFPDVFDHAQLSRLDKRGLRYELWRIRPDSGKRQVIVASSTLPVNPVDSSLELPNGRWTLSVAPVEGWGDPVGLTIKTVIGLIISLLLSLLIRSLLNTRAAALQIAGKLTIELRKSEQRYKAISSCNRALVQADDEQSLLDNICRIICDEAGYRFSWVGYAQYDNGKTVHPVAWAGFNGGDIGSAGLSWDETSEDGQGPAGTVIRSGEIVYIQDIAIDPRTTPWRGSALQYGYHSVIAIPLQDESKSTFGVLLIYSTEVNAFSEEELGLLEELAGDLAFGITTLRTREALQKSEERLRLEVTRMPIGYIVWDQEFRVVTWNPAAEEIFGFTFDEMKGCHPYETIVPSEAQPLVDNIWERLLSGDSSAHSVNENLTKDGRNIVCEWTNTPLKQADGTILGAISMVQDITERKRAEDKIHKLNQELEQRVQERTIELRERNDELTVEIHERKQALEELRKAKTQLEEANRLLENLSVTDPLTGLANRRRFDQVLAKEFSRRVRSGAELSLIMLDIDHFKAYNDSYGHVSGDICLQRIAQVMAESVSRATDIAARYGGEEFACILPETDLHGAVAIAEKIRLGIQQLAIQHDSSTTADYVTASLGVASVTCKIGMSTSNVIALADNMLYKAKEGGRNRVEADTFGSDQQPGLGNNFVQLVWQNTLCSGNRLIDTQHQELFRQSNRLLDAVESLRPNSVIVEMITHLLDDISKHFHDEETILKSVHFPGQVLHAEEHAKLYKRGLEIVKTIHADAYDLGDIVKFLVYEVVSRHMHQSDRKFFSFLKTT